MEKNEATRVAREIKVNAYIVDERSLRQIDEVSKGAVVEPGGAQVPTASYSIATLSRELIPLRSLDELIHHLDRVSDKIRSLSLKYTYERQAGIDIVFSTEGEIRVSGFSGSPDFQFNISQLDEILLTMQEEH